MDISLPPIPTDLWPKITGVSAKRLKPNRLILEIPIAAGTPLLAALSLAVRLEMRSAGEWAARISPTPKQAFPLEPVFVRANAQNAGRLLAIYTALYRAAPSPMELYPDALQAAASRSFQIRLRNGHRRSAEHDEPSSPSTFTPHPTKPTPTSKTKHESSSNI